MSQPTRWKRVKGFENYCVSDGGKVWSHNNNQEKKSYPDKKGYMRVQLRGAIVYTYKVHRLVALHFIPNPDNLAQVNHIDGVKDNNYYMNLEWCTNYDNAQHSLRLGLFVGRKDIPEKLPKILGALIDGHYAYDIAKKLKSSTTTIYRHLSKSTVIPDFDHKEVSRATRQHKGYYFDKSRNMYRVDAPHIKTKTFELSTEARDYVISERRKAFKKGIISSVEPTSEGKRRP